ncbi:uncharacterized protein [Euphorbia lathyris]|uniref:uncharacterized protein n=1 Tax=Euphorbia lathyris TaxID=212925 RepID=UPI003314296E
MAPLLYFNFRKVLPLFLFISLLFFVSSNASQLDRRMLGTMEKNQTKLIKSNLSTKNQTKLLPKPPSKSTNSTKTSLPKPPSLSKLNFTSLPKNLNSTSLLKLKKQQLNSTSLLKKKFNSTSKSYNSTSKSYNSTKTSSSSTKKISDLIKLESPKNKTTTKQTPPILKQKKPSAPIWVDQDADDDDLVSEFRDLPSKFQQSILPDFETISSVSKKYLTKANKEMTKGFKPIVGHKYASISATVVSFAFILIPLLLVSLVVNRIKAYFSIQKIVIFIQVYLSIYFSILCVSSIVTGLEPLKFFYATSQSTYVCLMVLQTLGYVLYLLLLVMYLILVFSTESGLGSKLLCLAQIFVGLAVGLHFYLAVFHRVVLHQPPKTNWKIHGVYATCFLLICLFAKFDRRKKAYLEDGGEEGKKN